VIAACRSECGLTWRGMPGGLRDPDDHAVHVTVVDRLAGVHPGQPEYTAGSAAMIPSMGEPEEPAHAVHHRADRGVPQPAASQMPNVKLHGARCTPTRASRPLLSQPTEPATQLVGVELMGVPRVPRQGKTRRQLCRCHRIWLERQQGRRDRHDRLRGDLAPGLGQARRTHGEAPGRFAVSVPTGAATRASLHTRRRIQCSKERTRRYDAPLRLP
jgi:hypothetical protein